MTASPSFHAAWIALIVCAAPLCSRADEKPARPNVLFVVSDDLNCDLACYGHRRVKSPSIDRLAARGVRFERAYCQDPLCNPSRASMMTGLYPPQTKVITNADRFRNHLPNVVTLPRLFMQNGYYVARIGKIFHYGVPNQIGTDGEDDPKSWHERFNPRGIDREVHDRIHTLQKGRFGATLSWLNLDSRDEEHTDAIGASKAIELLEKHHPAETGKPFFLAVGFYRPHTPYVAPSRYFDLYPREKISPSIEVPGDRDDIPVAALPDRLRQRELSLEERREIIQAYYASITFMDAQLGRILDALDRLKLADSTVVVFVSDHGYQLGDHGLWQKTDLFEGSARVPLVVAAPGCKAAGKSSGAVVELVDLYPTLAQLCDLPRDKSLAGESFAASLDDASLPGKAAAWTMTESRAQIMHREFRGRTVIGHSIRTPRYRYTEWNDGADGVELYDYQTDPRELTNLAVDQSHAKTVARLKTLLAETKRRGQ